MRLRIMLVTTMCFALFSAIVTATNISQDIALAASLPAATPVPLHLPLIGRAMKAPLLPPTPAPVIPSAGLPLSGFVVADFDGPDICAQCHGDLKDEGGNDVTMSTFWRSTMMANAARDPFWQAKVSSEIARNPARQGDIERLCSRCHMPMAYTEAIDAGQTPAIFGPQGFLDPGHPLHEAAIDGVSCTLCHQIQPQNLGQPASFNGHFVIDTSTEPPRRIVFGPYPNPNSLGVSIMRTGSGYTPQQGTHLRTSAVCATCHTLYTSFVDSQGQDKQFPEQVPYLEWQHSSYGESQSGQRDCQDCHMPLADGAVVLYGGWPAHEPFYQHYFVGGNSFICRYCRRM